jgi:hypothetical protein
MPSLSITWVHKETDNHVSTYIPNPSPIRPASYPIKHIHIPKTLQHTKSKTVNAHRETITVTKPPHPSHPHNKRSPSLSYPIIQPMIRRRPIIPRTPIRPQPLLDVLNSLYLLEVQRSLFERYSVEVDGRSRIRSLRPVASSLVCYKLDRRCRYGICSRF